MLSVNHADQKKVRPPSALSRREFARVTLASAAVLAADVSGAARAAEPRRAVAMWDFSWLTRRTAPEAEYADFDRVLDELTMRGYNCVRIDAFPHLVAPGPDKNKDERFAMLPQNRAFMWGNHAEVMIEPRAGLVEFMGKCRERRIRVGLSSWFQDDRAHRRSMMNTPADFARAWAETLAFLDEHGLLDLVEWVDLCNEFPLPVWAPGAARYLRDRGCGPGWPAYSAADQKILSDFFDASIHPLRSRWPGLRYCYSVAAVDAANFRAADLSAFGALEPHMWLNNNATFAVSSGLLSTLLNVPGATRLVRVAAPAAYFPLKKHWLGWLARKMDAWSALAARVNLPLYTTEGWGPINYEDLPSADDAREWRWVKDSCAAAVDLALARGWTGMCSSNFCGPQHPGMWNDVAWHQKVTAAITS